MRDFPTDPMRQHTRFMAAFCDDLFDMVVHKTKGTPRADRVCEISRQLHAISTERQQGSGGNSGSREPSHSSVSRPIGFDPGREGGDE